MIINTNNGSSMAARILGESTNALQKFSPIFDLSTLSFSKAEIAFDKLEGTCFVARTFSIPSRSSAGKSLYLFLIPNMLAFKIDDVTI